MKREYDNPEIDIVKFDFEGVMGGIPDTDIESSGWDRELTIEGETF